MFQLIILKTSKIKNQHYLFDISFIVIAILLLFSQCANVVAPTGGPKDSMPPGIKFSYPKNYATQFNADNIIIEFDEYVSLNNPASEVLISPPLENEPEFRIKKKSLIIDLNNNLKANTTYTINMGAAIKDITEGNILKDYRFVFSTGSYIDSFQISGQIRNAKNNKTEENILVMLYKGEDDSMPYKNTPNYLSKTDKQGNYHIENVSQGTYLLFALKDQNGNRLYDLPNEQIAFLNKVVIDDSTKTTHLKMFEEVQAAKLMEAHSNEIGKVVFVFSGKTEFVKVVEKKSNAQKRANDIMTYNFNRDTAIYWSSNIYDSTKTFIIYDKDIAIDTAGVEMERPMQRANIQKEYPLKIDKIKKMITPKPLSLLWSQPLLLFNKDKIHLYEDTLSNEVRSKIYFADSILKQSIQIDYPWNSNKKYILTILEKSVTSIFNTSNDSIGFVFNVIALEKLANLNMKFELEYNSDAKKYIFFIKDSRGKIVFKKRIPSTKELLITKFPPGEYFLEVLFDENNNGKWDSGDFLQKRQPEKIYFYSDKIKLRANWDMDLVFKLKK